MQTLEQRSAELELLHRRLNSTETKADSLQIDVAAQTTRIENLSDELKEARRAKRDGEEQKHKLETELKALQHSLGQETKRGDGAETRASELMTKLSDNEAKLLRREKEVERLNERLRTIIAEGRKQGVAADHAPRGKQALVQAEESKRLREEMNALASQVVAMVARLEGPSSPVNKLLASAGGEVPVAYDENGEAIDHRCEGRHRVAGNQFRITAITCGQDQLVQIGQGFRRWPVHIGNGNRTASCSRSGSGKAEKPCGQ